jgi:SAM-dependent methyltransferase
MEFDEKFWEERYSSHTKVWSGRPNLPIVAETTDLTPGTALDAASGEGADAVWLASRGWKVTAVDFSATALERGAAHNGDIRWIQADLTSWQPGETFDLVTSHYMHPPGVQRDAVFAKLAGMVAPGGTLLIVGHHPSDMHTTAHRPDLPDLYFTAEQVADLLDPGSWEILVTDARPRVAKDPAGEEVTIQDAVLKARKRPEPGQ